MRYCGIRRKTLSRRRAARLARPGRQVYCVGHRVGRAASSPLIGDACERTRPHRARRLLLCAWRTRARCQATCSSPTSQARLGSVTTVLGESSAIRGEHPYVTRHDGCSAPPRFASLPAAGAELKARRLRGRRPPSSRLSGGRRETLRKRLQRCLQVLRPLQRNPRRGPRKRGRPHCRRGRPSHRLIPRRRRRQRLQRRPHPQRGRQALRPRRSRCRRPHPRVSRARTTSLPSRWADASRATIVWSRSSSRFAPWTASPTRSG